MDWFSFVEGRKDESVKRNTQGDERSTRRENEYCSSKGKIGESKEEGLHMRRKCRTSTRERGR